MAQNCKKMALSFDLLPSAVMEVLERLDNIEKKLDTKETEPITKKGYISRQKVCELLDISLPTVHSWMKSGKLQAYHIGGRTLFRESEVLAAAKPVNYSIK